MNAIAQELRSRINPAYATQPGTESNERRVCAEEIERMEAELAVLKNQEPTGPLVEGWQITLSDGHSGYGAYAHMTDYPDEGAVFLAPGAQPVPEGMVLDAGHFYNLVMHAIMDVGAPHGGCKYRLQDIAKQLDELMLAAAKKEKT